MLFMKLLLKHRNKLHTFVVGKECYLYRGVEQFLLKVVRDFLAVAKSLAIFFCGHEHRCREGLGSRLHLPDVGS